MFPLGSVASKLDEQKCASLELSQEVPLLLVHSKWRNKADSGDVVAVGCCRNYFPINQRRNLYFIWSESRVTREINTVLYFFVPLITRYVDQNIGIVH